MGHWERSDRLCYQELPRCLSNTSQGEQNITNILQIKQPSRINKLNSGNKYLREDLIEMGKQKLSCVYA